MTETAKILEAESYKVRDEENPNLRWYIVQTQSNCEKKVKQNLKEAIIRKDCSEQIVSIFNPIIESEALKNGKKRKVFTKPFPGYIFVFCDMNDETFNVIKHTERVTGFPSKTQARPLPLPMSDKEIKDVLSIVSVQEEKAKNKYVFSEGVGVKINNPASPFNEMTGTIVSSNNEKGTAKVSIVILGRETDIEVPVTELVLNEG